MPCSVKLHLALVVATTSLAACAVGPLEEQPVPTEALPPTVAPAPLALPDAGSPEPEPADPAPDAAPAVEAEPDAAPTPVLVPGVGLRYAPGEGTLCGPRDEPPLLPDDRSTAKALASVAEENGGLVRPEVTTDTAELGLEIVPTPILIPTDRDGDCLSDLQEAIAGTDPDDPDTDHDGWFDGPCNERRKLVLIRITAHDEQEDIGDDEFYVVADDVRYPNRTFDDFWDMDDGTVLNTATTLATRTRGVAPERLALVKLEGHEDDFDIIGNWWPDDLLFETGIDLGAEEPGAEFTRRFTYDDYDYELRFRVDVEKFADPDPLADADRDGDGISDSSEALVARELGGITDPARQDVLVELDYMPGHAMRTETKRMVVTQLHRNGLALFIQRDTQLPLDGCLTVPEVRALYADHFDRKGMGAFRYAVMSEELWNERSGVAWGDVFLVDDDTWWINNWILPQAGTFIHELGHTLGLTSDVYSRIDTIAWFSYDSAMNYLYQATKVDYSSDGEGGDTNDHDDWAVVNPAYALRWSFALTQSTETGACH